MSNITVPAQELRTISDKKLHTLGAKYEDEEGRIYRYAKAGAVDLSPGKICINADLVANHTNIVVAAAVAVGSYEVTATLGATAATADQYADGWLTVNDATGEGINYAIAGNSAAGSAGTITVYLKEPIKVALTTSSEVTLKLNAYSGILISIADQADLPVGVPNVAITASYFGWVQTRGECAVLADEAVVKGSAVVLGSSTVGSVETKDSDDVVPQVGIASEALVDTEYRGVFLTLD